jgi:CRISPR-associated protein Cas1
MIIPAAAKLIPLSRRLPFFYLEHAVIKRVDNSIVVFDQDLAGYTAPSASMASLIIGPGCSITSEAAKEISKNGCSLIFSGESGLPILVKEHKYRSPLNKIRQYSIVTSKRDRLVAIKRLFLERSRFIDQMSLKIPQPSYDFAKSGEECMGIESGFMKKCYHLHSLTYGFKWSRKQDLNIKSPLKINYLNHLCYSTASVVIDHLGYDLDVGLLHGRSKGGGLVFDLADVFKPTYSLELSFKNLGASNKDLRKQFFDKMVNEDLLAKLVVALKKIL